MGPCSVTFMFRCALFGHFRMRMKQGSANPKEMFLCLAEVFRELLERTSWRLPTLAECLSAEDLGRLPAPVTAGSAEGSGERSEPPRKQPRRSAT